MSRILGIVGAGIMSSLVLSGTSWALPDRSALSFDENATINYACTYALKQGNDAFQNCVAQQMAALPEHPTPDRSGMTRAGRIGMPRWLRVCCSLVMATITASTAFGADAAKPLDGPVGQRRSILRRALVRRLARCGEADREHGQGEEASSCPVTLTVVAAPSLGAAAR